jgi:hypothetical protein
VDEIVVAEEPGRALAPSPFFATQLAVLHGGTELKKGSRDVAAGRKTRPSRSRESGNDNAASSRRRR